jgi:hypothetical protein
MMQNTFSSSFVRVPKVLTSAMLFKSPSSNSVTQCILLAVNPSKIENKVTVLVRFTTAMTKYLTETMQVRKDLF